MAINLTATFETKAAAHAADLEASRAEANQIAVHWWAAGWEAQYNAGGILPDDTLPDGNITQNRMNNYVKAAFYIDKFLSGTFVQADLDWMTTNSLNIASALAGVAQYDAGIFDNS